jgi:hypothetical protein
LDLVLDLFWFQFDFGSGFEFGFELGFGFLTNSNSTHFLGFRSEYEEEPC